MEKLLIFTFLLVFGVTVANEKERTKKNLDKLSEKKRTEYLLEVTKAAILKHRTGWYRDVGEYKIERIEWDDESSINFFGKVSYIIIRYCDPKKEVFAYGYSTNVFVNEATGKATDIRFGDGGGFGELDNPKFEKEKHPFFKKFIEGESSKRK